MAYTTGSNIMASSLDDNHTQFKLRNQKALAWFSNFITSNNELLAQNGVVYSIDYEELTADFTGSIEFVLLNGGYTIQETYDFVQSKTKPNHFKKINGIWKILKPSNLLAIVTLCVVLWLVYSVGSFMRSDSSSAELARRMMPDFSMTVSTPTPDSEEGFIAKLFPGKSEPTNVPTPTPEESKGIIAKVLSLNIGTKETPTIVLTPTPTPAPTKGFLGGLLPKPAEPQKEDLLIDEPTNRNSAGMLFMLNIVACIIALIVGGVAYRNVDKLGSIMGKLYGS